MYAVVKTGGKQYRVAPGDILIVEKLIGDAGAKVKLDNVLIVGEDGKDPEVGIPMVSNATVNCEVVEQSRADKVVVFKKKRRQGYKRKKGHRQDQTVLRVLDINGKGALKTPAKKMSEPKASGSKPKVAEKPKSDTSKTVKAKSSTAKNSSEVKSPAPKKETAAGKELAVSEPNAEKKAPIKRKSSPKTKEEK